MNAIVDRRRFLGAAAIAGFGTQGFLSGLGAVSPAPPDSSPRLVSVLGCGRATGYSEANKIVTLRGRTHVAWLDSPPEGFRARIRTLDRRSGAWSDPVTLGEAHDNHGGPALTVDAEGYLHVLFGPHHHPFRYRRSVRPHDASEWEPEILVGEQLTYPTLVCGADNTLHLTARRSHKGRPWEVEHWIKPAGADWRRQGLLLSSRMKGYAHFLESLAWGPDHRTLHLACRFHEGSDRDAYGRLQHVAYLRSPDAGRSWFKANGEPVRLPATSLTADVLESGGVDQGRVLRVGAIACSPAGVPHLIYCVEEDREATTYLAHPESDGTWKRRNLSEALPPRWRDWNLILAGALAFTPGGVLHGVAMVQKAKPEESTWGNPSNEVLRFETSVFSGAIRWETVSEPDPTVSQWLPNLERPTGFNEIAPRPSVLFTSGGPGQDNRELMRNRVFWSA